MRRTQWGKRRLCPPRSPSERTPPVDPPRPSDRRHGRATPILSRGLPSVRADQRSTRSAPSKSGAETPRRPLAGRPTGYFSNSPREVSKWPVGGAKPPATGLEPPAAGLRRPTGTSKTSRGRSETSRGGFGTTHWHVQNLPRQVWNLPRLVGNHPLARPKPPARGLEAAPLDLHSPSDRPVQPTASTALPPAMDAAPDTLWPAVIFHLAQHEAARPASFHAA